MVKGIIYGLVGPEGIRYIADANRGKKRSPETRERMRQAWVLRRAGSAQ